ncbi:MAG: AAA family ATPase [Acidimicrobiales bacterium]
MQFDGFAFTGFRSFVDEISWVTMKGPVTLLLGANNSGKSSLVRLALALPEICRLTVENVTNPNVFSSAMDRPRLAPNSHFQIWLPLDFDQIVGRLGNSAASSLSDVLLSSGLMKEGRFNGFYIKVDFSWSQDTIIRDDFQSTSAAEIEQANPQAWREALQALTGSAGGGSIGVMVDQVYGIMRRSIYRPPKMRFVPPERAIRPSVEHKLGPFDGLIVDGGDVISTLYNLKNSGDESDLERYRMIKDHMAILLRDPGFECVFPDPARSLSLCLGGKFFPLESVGTGTAHALIILLAALGMDTEMLILEEPDAHMHPRLQRELLRLLRDRAKSGVGARVVVSTHSSHLVDAATDDVVRLTSIEGRSTSSPIRAQELFGHLSDLGYRASDILQADSIIWVEGPSDRIYLNYWLSVTDPRLVEGVHYSIVFFGGTLLSEMSADNEDPPVELVDLRRVNQNLVIVADRDRVNKREPLKRRVERLKTEVEASSRGCVWVTDGYAIENYLDSSLLLKAVKKVHPSVIAIDPYGKSKDPLRGLRKADRSLLKDPNKVRIAAEVVRQKPMIEGGSELSEHVRRVAEFVHWCFSGEGLH